MRARMVELVPGQLRSRARYRAAVIVTGDDDLLSLNLMPPAITPRALLDLLASLR